MFNAATGEITISSAPASMLPQRLDTYLASGWTSLKSRIFWLKSVSFFAQLCVCVCVHACAKGDSAASAAMGTAPSYSTLLKIQGTAMIKLCRTRMIPPIRAWFKMQYIHNRTLKVIKMSGRHWGAKIYNKTQAIDWSLIMAESIYGTN
jgi:hypothetical protein